MSMSSPGKALVEAGRRAWARPIARHGLGEISGHLEYLQARHPAVAGDARVSLPPW